jgi:cysteine desulfuration protein SufE
MSINQIQDKIIEEFATLDGDLESVLCHIIRTGLVLPAMSIEDRTHENLIKGCHSNVWLTAKADANKIFFSADSDTNISKGLVSLLLRVFNGRHPDEILKADIYFITQSRLERFVGTKRSNGFSAMLDQIKNWATKAK